MNFSKTILLIDDDKDDRFLFSEALAAIDPFILFTYAETAEEGLTYLTNPNATAPAFVFLDINLPLMSGWQCLAEIKKNSKLNSIRVVMYSTSSHQRDRDLAEELGAFCFISKPDEYKLLKTMLSIVVKAVHEEGKLATLCKEVLALR